MDTAVEPRQVRREASNAANAERDIGRYATAFGVSLGLTSLFNALLVLVKETNQETVLAWMTAATGHHWVTQGGAGVAGVRRPRPGALEDGESWRFRPDLVIASVAGGVVVGSPAIAWFFL